MAEQRDATAFDGILDNYSPAQRDELPPEEEQELVKRLDEAFEAAYEVRVPYERDWELYRLYLKGDQLVARNPDTGDVVRLSNEDSKRLRSVNNVLRPTARSLVGKMARTIPTCVVVPATADFEEIQGARAATALLEYARRKEDLDLKYVEGIEFMPWAGNALYQLVWNRQGGRTLAWCGICSYNTPDLSGVGGPCPQCEMQKENEAQQQQQEHQMAMEQALMQANAELPPDYMGPPLTPEDVAEVPPPDMQQLGPLPVDQEVPPLEEVKEGDFEVRVRDVRDFYVEAGAASLKAAHWVCYRAPMPVHEARRLFPEFAQVIKAEDNIQADRTSNLRYNSIDSYGDAEYLTDHCYLYEFHEKPSEGYPKGRVIFKVNGRIVDLLDGVDGREENPYFVLGRYPFYMFQFDRNIGEFWGEPFLAQAWHRQREINQLETNIREHIELLLKPKIGIPIGSRISQDEWTAATAQLIKYNKAAGDPKVFEYPPLPQQVFGRRDELIGDVRFQASVTEQEAGVSQSDPNGRAMAIIEAEADQQLGAMMLRIHSEWRELHRGILQLFRAYAHEDRLWTVMGPDGLRTWSFEELRLEPGHDVQIEQDDGLSRNPAIRLQQAMDVKNAAPELFTDPMTGMPDAKKFSRYARLSVRDAGYEMEATERAAAAQIPKMIEQGQMPEPQPEDDPMIFAEELLGWLRGPGRRADPQITMTVRNIWMYYASWAQMGSPPGMLGGQGPGAPQQGPGAGPGGPDQSAMGGSANNPGNIASDAMGQVGQADRGAEAQAQVTANREG